MVRVPAHDLLRGMLAATGPVASTSANRHGAPPAGSAPAAELALGEDVAGVVDGGPSTGVASTIIDLSSRPPCLLREGPIASIALRPYIGGTTPARKREAGT
jgi:tRNA A37 threonylcarbamoyladenosine synthetase subunit TsaC/SUA5/YrdC